MIAEPGAPTIPAPGSRYDVCRRAAPVRLGALLAAAVFAAGAVRADTGTSDPFTIDLRTSLASTVRLERIDDLRSPLLLETRPGDELRLYFVLRKASGEPLEAETFDYAVKLSGATATETGAVAWSVDRPGVVRLTLRADGLAFSTNPARLLFPQGSGWAKVDGFPVTIENALPDVSLSRLPSPYRDLYVIYSEGSAGTSGTIGTGPGAAGTKASLDAARLSVEGLAGVGFAMELGPDGSLALERRASLSAATALEVPSFELATTRPFGVSGPSIAAGGERGGGLGQRLELAAEEVLTDEGRVTNAAFFLETASLAGALVPSPFVGLVQRAAAETALRLSGAAELLRTARREESAETAVGGSLASQALSVENPVASSGVTSTTPLALSLASIEGIVASRSALRRTSPGGGDGLQNRWTAALSGSTAPANWESTLRRIFGPTWGDSYSFSTSVNASLGTGGNLQQAGVDLGAQSSQQGDIALYRTRDHDGFDVRMRLDDASILEALRHEGPSQLGPLAGDDGAALSLTRDSAFSTATYILDRAEALAPAGTVAYVAGADRRNARVRTGEFDLGLVSGLLVGGDSSVAFSGGWEQARLVEDAVRTCRSDGQSWDVRKNSTTASWEDAPSLEQLLSGHLFSGVGPLLEGALRGLLGTTSKVLAPAVRGAPASRLAIDPLEVDDPTTGRRGGRAEFPGTFDGFSATLQTGDPSRPEATARSGSGAPSVRRALTTRRVFTGTAPPSRRAAREREASSSTQLTLIGNFVSLEAKPDGGAPADPLPAPVTLTVDLYEDQATRMGAEPNRLAEAKLFRYDAASGAWQLVGGSVPAGGSSISASVTRPGTYAPGILETMAAGDSDGDGLLDTAEDANGNGIVDAGESDPWTRDSDGDGVDDAEERRAGTDPMAAASAPNRRPALGYVGNRKLHVGEALNLTLRGTDADGDPLTFSAQGLPPGASLDASTGAFAFTPTAAGTWRISFTATDSPRSGSPLSDTKPVVLEAQRVAADGELTTLTRAVPVVLDVRGANSSHYTTELTLTNRGATAVSLTLRYQASIGDPSGSGATADSLAPGEQRIIPDTLSYLRSLGLPVPDTAAGSQGGVLLVRFDGAASEATVAATARTTTATAPPQPAGAAGLSYPGSPPDTASEGSLTICGLRDDANDRSNVAVFNPAADPVTVRVTAFSGDGTGFSRVLRENLAIPGFGWEQLSGVFAGTGISSGWVTIQRTSTSGRFGAYGIVNDNTTNDGSYVPPTAAPVAGSRLTVPVLVETPAYRSELVLVNRSASTATLTLRYVEGLTPSLGPGGTARVVLRPHEQQVIPDAIEALRSLGIEIGAKGAGEFAGALAISVAGAALADVFAGARTAAPSPAGGRYGLFTPGVVDGETAGEEAWVYGLRADASSRSNLAVVNAGADGDGPVTLELQVFDGDRGGIPAGSPREIVLAPGLWAQETGLLGSVGVRNGWARVRRISGTGAWLAYGVVVDGSNPGERTGDGSYVPMSTTEGNEITVALPGGVPLVLVRIPAGTFQMGAPSGERGASAEEQPLHQVTLTQDFYIGKYEVTQAQWKAVMGTNPSLFTACGESCPVEQIYWEQVRGPDGFIQKLNALLGTTKFRLPTEAEWERAARGGTQTRFSFGDALDGDDACATNAAASPFVWWCGTSLSSTHPVGTKGANAFGLFDVHGNVWEMVEDWLGTYPSTAQTDPTGPSTGSVRAVRGGGWFQLLRSTRSAARYFDSQELGFGVIGFRLARSR